MDVPIRIDIFSILIFLGLVQGGFLSTLLFSKRESNFYPNLYLSLLLVANTFFLVELFLSYSGYIIYSLHLVDFSEPANFIYGPLLYLYIRSFLGIEKKKSDWMHFIPFFFYLAYSVFFFMQSGDYKYNAYIFSHHPDLPFLDAPAIFSEDPLGIKGYTNELGVVFNGVYTFLALRFSLISSNYDLKSFFWPSTDRKVWIRNLLAIQLLSYISWLYRTIFSFRDLDDYLAATFTSIVIYYVSYILFLKPKVLERSSNQKKYSKSNLSNESKKDIVFKLDKLMREELVYRESNLSLSILSQKIAASPHNVSQALNEELDLSFFDYLGFYRIEEAKKILIEDKGNNLAIDEIAEQVGYNSKSAFYKVFKKQVGLTPAEFRKSNSV